MQNEQNKIPWSTKMGFIIGPIFIALGLYLKNQNTQGYLSVILIVVGIFRLGMTSWLYFNHPSRNK